MRATHRVNEGLVEMMINEMPEAKKAVLRKALERNCILTSCWIMEHGDLTVYKEGFYLQLYGTRSSFAVYYKDEDGELVQMRKPAESKLTKLYTDSIHFNECDFDRI